MDVQVGKVLSSIGLGVSHAIHHRVVTYIYSKWFDIPVYSLVPYITERLFLETDFENEANNAERMAQLVADEPRLKGRVYIPRVYRELSSKRVMTAEWIEGVRLWDKETLAAPWKGGCGRGSPGCRGTPLDVAGRTRQSPGDQIVGPARSSHGWLKPERAWWRGPDGNGGLGVRLKDVMTIMVDLFSAQMFLWGVVHVDPHPGNLFGRRTPSGEAELVLIDHGLYIHIEPKLRHQYALFWKSLLTFDNKTLREIVQEWGVSNVDIFASATLLRPYTGGDRSTERRIQGLGGQDDTGDPQQQQQQQQQQRGFLRRRTSNSDQAARAFEAQEKMRQGIREVLGGDNSKWPQALVFLGRNLRIVQGNNQYLGSPVNRIKITGMWASRALVESPDLPWSQKVANLYRHVLFRLVLLTTDIAFYMARAKQLLGRGGGLEDEMEKQLKNVAKDTFGVELNHAVFEG